MQIDERDGAARLYGGTGLGPPISKGLIEAHHGQLVIDSSPGRGTRVRVIRPPRRCRSAGRNRAPRGRRATIAPSPDRGPARSAADPPRPFSKPAGR
jgi:Histidine kinase-, DNA gyrase B-, and HSP90-like ATPase